MSNIEISIEALYELAEKSSSIPFTTSIKVDREELFRILASIKTDLPEELDEAKRIVYDCEQFIENAKREADAIIKQAEFEASKLVSENEVYLKAAEAAERLKIEAEEEAENSLMEATIYVDQLLADAGKAAEDARRVMEQQCNSVTDSFARTANIILQIRDDIRGN